MVERPGESFWDVKVPCKGTYGSQPDCPCIWHLGCAKETAERLGTKAANLIVEIVNDKQKGIDNPIYKHNCKQCVYLGHHISTAFKWKKHWATIYDLYFCSKSPIGATVIARYGNDGSAYYSGLPAAVEQVMLAQKGNKDAQKHPLRIALLRARESTIIKPEDKKALEDFLSQVKL